MVRLPLPPPPLLVLLLLSVPDSLSLDLHHNWMQLHHMSSSPVPDAASSTLLLGRVPLLPHYDARPDTVPHRTAVLHDVQHQTSQPTDLHHGHLVAPHTALSHIMPHVHHTCQFLMIHHPSMESNVFPDQWKVPFHRHGRVCTNIRTPEVHHHLPFCEVFQNRYSTKLADKLPFY